MIVRKKANTIYIYIQTRPPESTPTPLTNYELQKAILFFFSYKFVMSTFGGHPHAHVYHTRLYICF